MTFVCKGFPAAVDNLRGTRYRRHSSRDRRYAPARASTIGRTDDTWSAYADYSPRFNEDREEIPGPELERQIAAAAYLVSEGLCHMGVAGPDRSVEND